jgi:PhoD-like phosphatase
MKRFNVDNHPLTERASRRDVLRFLAGSASVLAFTGSGSLAAYAELRREEEWNSGELAHLIPSVNHSAILIKTSFHTAQKNVPMLQVGSSRSIKGEMTDSTGHFWQFYAQELDAGTTYELQLRNNKGGVLTDPWPLSTFPHPDADADRLRIFAYTCAGGNERPRLPSGEPFFLSLADRRRLLQRGLEFNPDVVIANGDHIYWDQDTLFNKPQALQAPWLELFAEYGSLDRNIPAIGTSNEAVLKRIVNDQIAKLYGVMFRSVPVYMLTDDHDMFENDEASDQRITLPPDWHMLDAARSTQKLYYPEFLPETTRSRWLPGSSAADRADGLSEVFGTLRYGKLFEALLYDTKRYVSLKGPTGAMVPASTEQWLKSRTASTQTAHLMHIPSTPFGWSAGKWGEWYPDMLQEDGSLGTGREKKYWPSGWWSQHQRILQMITGQSKRPPVIISGDLHALSYGKMHNSGALDFSKNPVHTFCVGPIGTSGPGFPSRYRGIGAQVPSQLDLDELLRPLEENGFSIIDVTSKAMRIRMFAWRPPASASSIDTMSPLEEFEISL